MHEKVLNVISLWELQIKITMICHLTHTRMAIKKIKYNKCFKDVENWNPQTLADITAL